MDEWTMIEIPPGHRAIVLPVALTDRPALDALSAMWHKIQGGDERIPDAQFVLTPGRSSSCDSVEFDVSPVIQLNLRDGERVLSGREVLERLLHLAAHAATFKAGRASSEGRYHSDSLRQVAQELGLRMADVRKPGIGFEVEGLARGTLTRYGDEIRALDKALKSWQPSQTRKDMRGPIGMACQCVPARRFRIHRGVAELGPIVCGVCGQEFR